MVFVGCGTIASLLLLFLAHLLYIQFVLLVWGGALIAGISIYEDAHPPERGRAEGADEDDQARLEADLAELKSMQSKASDPAERRSLRRKEEAVGLELRRLRWSQKEREMEIAERAFGQPLLRAIPRRGGWWARMQQSRKDLNVLVGYLDEVEGTLEAEPAQSALARLAKIASEVKGHLRLIGRREDRGAYGGEYATSWAFLASLSERRRPDPVSRGTSRKVKSRLDNILRMAISLRLLDEGPMSEREGWE